MCETRVISMAQALCMESYKLRETVIVGNGRAVTSLSRGGNVTPRDLGCFYSLHCHRGPSHLPSPHELR